MISKSYKKSSKFPAKNRLLFLCLLIVVISRPLYASSASYIAEQKQIREIISDLTTAPKRTKAINTLLQIVQDEKADIHFRCFAAEALGKISADQAKQILYEIADELDFTKESTDLKWSAYLAYRQIDWAQQINNQKKIEFLQQLLFDKFEDRPAANVQIWAAEKLAATGTSQYLSEIEKSVRQRQDPNNTEQYITFYKTINKLIFSYRKKDDALTRAMADKDPTKSQLVKKWVINEYAEQDSEDARYVLISYALSLQDNYYDKQNNRINDPNDLQSAEAANLYNTIINTLKIQGLTDTQISEYGLRPEQYFVVDN
jgi:hypothetical protein